MIDIRTIGAGGGSIAWIDKGGMLRVGPQSAGAEPGPACYGQGGTEATVTDANLVLGRIDPDYFLGGAHEARRRRGASARSPRSPSAIGQGVRGRRRWPSCASPTTTWSAPLRSVLIERGLDPRDFTLCAFGGAGPLHAATLMREMGIPRGDRPQPSRPVLGLRLHHDRRPGRPAAHDAADLAAASTRRGPARSWRPWSREAAAELAEQGYTRAASRSCRGAGDALSRPELRAGAAGRRRRARRRRRPSGCGRRSTRRTRPASASHIPGEIIEIVNYTATVLSRTDKPELPRLAAGRRAAEPDGERRGPLRQRRRRRRRSSGATSCAHGHAHRRAGADRGGGLGDGRRARPAPDGRRVRPPPHRRGRLRDETMRFSANGYYIEQLPEVRQLRHAGLRRGHRAASATARTASTAPTGASSGRARTTARPAMSVCRSCSRSCRSRQAYRPSARSTPDPGDDEHPGFDHGVDLPGDGHPADEDVLLDDLQRGPRLHLRPRRRQGRHDRLRRVLPDHDRRHAAADQDLRAGDPVRHAGGGRHHPPQRPLSRRAALPRAHLLQAVLQSTASCWASPSASATSPRSAAWCRAPSAARRPRSSTRACACRRSRSGSAARTSRRSGSCCSPTSARRARTSATCAR